MRGFYEQRISAYNEGRVLDVDAALGAWSDPLGAHELSAAKAQGCVGCVWWTATTTRRAAACHHASKAGAVQADPDFWCSEWRGESSEETP